MATITLTNFYAGLDGFPPDLLRTEVGVVMGAKTATSFGFTYAAGTAFAGFTVQATGSQFTYDGAMPSEGRMTGLTIRDAGGHLVLSVTGILAGTLASDISALASYLFGFTDGNGDLHGPNVQVAWSVLMAGSDTITGSAGNDQQVSWGINAGNDLYNMGGGDDWVNGGLGNDTINGGDGHDILDYGQTSNDEGLAMVRGLSFDAATGLILDPFGFTDTISSIEEIHGTTTRDSFVSGDVGMSFMGLRGSDTITGGSSGRDWALYSDDHWLGGRRGIVADLQVSGSGGTINGTIRDGFGAVDKTVNLTNVGGTRFGDSFSGSSANNIFAGGEGKDSYAGKDGIDTIWFFRQFTGANQTGVVVDMTLASGQIRNDGFGNVENASSIEILVGSWQNDRLKGAVGADTVEGLHGNDTLTGAGGHDTFGFYHDFALGNKVVVTDFHAGGGGEQDHLAFAMLDMGFSTELHLVNGTAATDAIGTFIFNPTSHLLSYDADGTGSGAAVEIVTLNNVTALFAGNFDLL